MPRALFLTYAGGQVSMVLLLAQPAPVSIGYASKGRAAAGVQRALEAGCPDIRSKSTDAFQ